MSSLTIHCFPGLAWAWQKTWAGTWGSEQARLLVVIAQAPGQSPRMHIFT